MLNFHCEISEKGKIATSESSQEQLRGGRRPWDAVSVGTDSGPEVCLPRGAGRACSLCGTARGGGRRHLRPPESSKLPELAP